MSFNGRLNPLLSLSSSGSETATAMTASTLSLNSEGYFGMAAAAAASGDVSGTTAVLCERLSACQSALASKERTLRRLRAEQEEQLASLCRQMMSFECGLRRKQRELEAALGQRDRIIREQNAVIRFLMRKTGTKTRNIAKLRSEAMAKIPQIVDVTEEDGATAAAAPTVVSIEGSPNVCEGTKDGERGTPTPPAMRQPTTPPKHQQHLTTIRLNGELSSIVESASENGGDSDSAIILDDSVSSSASASIKSNNSTSSAGSTASCSSTAANIAGPSSMSLMNASRLKRISRSVSDVVTADNDGNDPSPEPPEEDCPSPSCGDEGRPESDVRSAGGGRSRVVKLVDDEDEDEDEDDLSDDYSTVEEEVDEQGDDDSGSGGGAPFDSSHYRGFLLRHGSFERFKKSAKTGGGGGGGGTGGGTSAADEQGVVVTVNGGGCGGGGKVPSINHRSVTKPRDVKNRRAKLGTHGLAARGNVPGASDPAAAVPSVSESIRSFVEKRGSVYKSVFLEQGPVSHSFA